LLVTSGQLSQNEARRQITNISIEEPCESPPRFLQVINASDRIWLLPLDGCESWTVSYSPILASAKVNVICKGFLAHFYNQDEKFDEDYVVTYRQTVQGPKEWPDLIALAKKETLRLRVRSRGLYTRANSDPSSSSNSAAKSSSLVQAINLLGIKPSSMYVRPASTGAKEGLTDTAGTAEGVSFDAENAGNPEDRDIMTIPKDLEQTRRTIKVTRRKFHLFYWLAAVSRQPKTNTTEQGVIIPPADPESGQPLDATCFKVDLTKVAMLSSQLELMVERCLEPGLSLVEQIPVDCPRRSLRDVQAKLLETQRARYADDDTSHLKKDGRRRRQHSSDNDSNARASSTSHHGRSASKTRRPHRLPCESVVSLAKQLYRFLLPLDYSSEVLSRYWGTIYWYLDNPDAEGTTTIQDQSRRRDFRRNFRNLAKHIQRGPPPESIELSDDLNDLWRRFVSIFVRGTSRSPRKSIVSKFQMCKDLIRSSRTKLLKSLQPNTLESMEAVLPNDIVSLLIRKLLKDVTNDAPDIFTTNYDFVLRLEQEVQRKPYSRTHQEPLSSLRQEITCVLQVLEHQYSVVQDLQQSHDQGPTYSADRFGPRREDSILQECLIVLEDRISNFNSLEHHARDLTSFTSTYQNLLRIESSKDRQEAAIVVFTIVTIIFLPLSFVSSFFGMNTTDIRDTKYPQWIFWASALPLTIAVVGIALFVAQKMEPVQDLWSRFSEKLDARHEAPSRIYRPPTEDQKGSRNTVGDVEVPDESSSGWGFRNTSPPPPPLPHPPPPPRSPSVEYMPESRSAVVSPEYRMRNSNSRR
ncbi:MAG: hypothetical protein Q9224_004573, partial [Gallowayella concinna]